MAVAEKARVAVSSFCCASSKAAVFNAATVRLLNGDAVAVPRARTRRGIEGCIFEKFSKEM